MTKFIKHTLLLLFVGSHVLLNAQKIAFIPQPEMVTYGKGSFQLTSQTTVLVPKKYKIDFTQYVASKFQGDLGIDLTFADRKPKNDEKYIQFKLNKNTEVNEEGYLISISINQVVISAKDYGGLFNGFQTLRQTFPLEKTATVELPVLEIRDNPRFEWRGVLLDVSRHFQTKEFILKQIDILSSYKINKFHWHLTDDQGWRIELKKYPNLTEKGAWRADRTGVHWWSRNKATAEEPKNIGGFYTQEDIKEVIEYAKIRNVEIIPEIDVPGHSKALIASYPELFCYDEVPEDVSFEVAVGGKAPNNAVCPGKENTYSFMEGIIEEVADLFPSKYLHIGGDECNKTNWTKCPYCQEVKETNNLEDEEELQSHFIQRMHALVKKQKKTMIGWDEILSGKGAPGATIMAWRRGRFTPEITAPQDGYPTIMTSYRYMYISQVQGPTISEPEGPRVVLPLSKVYSHEPVPKELTAAEKELVLGNQASLWSEFTSTPEHCEYMLYPRTLASAEVSWSRPQVKNWERFQYALEDYHFTKLKNQDVNVAKSLYSVYPSYAIDELHGEAIVYLQTEAAGHKIRYTLDGSEPKAESTVYKNEFRAATKSYLKAALFDDNGKRKGEILELRLK